MVESRISVEDWPAECDALFQALPVAVAIIDNHGRVRRANDALCSLLEYSHEQITNLRVPELLHAGESSEDLATRAADPALAPGGLFRDQRRFVDATGTSVFCDVFSTIRTDSEGHRVWVTSFVNVGQRRSLVQALRHEATHDELTGLLNRKGTRELLEQLLADESDDDRQLGVLLCDIDNFKRVNDALGHEVGDELLVTVAERLQQGMPSGCTPARHSGDEFFIVCSDLRAAGGLDALSEHVLALLRTTVVARGCSIGVSVSVGAATVPHAGNTAADLLRFADAALFQAKDQGRDRVICADAGLLTSIEQDVALEGQLRLALERDELSLHYQPVVDRRGRVVAAEALLRWPHPERGLLHPDVILPVARRAGLLGELDRWVLRTAVHQAANWPAPGARPIDVAINLGSQLLHDPAFLETVIAAVTEAGLAWQRLGLEITETDLLDLTAATQKAMTDLVDRGVRFAIDDFGIGYSSLARLQEIPAQVLKLDRTFTAGLEHAPIATAVARSAQTLAHAMGGFCVAEGVETRTQLHRLAGLGYDTFQGFLFSGAVPNSELYTLITRPPTP
ncbi:putative bifunctional diguanylate cyclase/phosphodiesterase [Salinifilum ghardaiensis]